MIQFKQSIVFAGLVEPSKGDQKMFHAAFPMPVMMDDGSFVVVEVPRMTDTEFEFFRGQLDVYRRGIVVDKGNTHVAHGNAELDSERNMNHPQSERRKTNE